MYFWFATTASNSIWEPRTPKMLGTCEESRTIAKNTRMTVLFWKLYVVASMVKFLSVLNFKSSVFADVRKKEKQMKILVVSLISKWDFCICIEMQSISVFPHKRENLLYYENSVHLRHFLESQCKVPVALIRLFKKLGVLNFQNC